MTTSQPAILIIQPLMPQLDEKLTQHFHCYRLYEQPDPAVFIARHGTAIKAIVTRGDVGVETALLEQLPECKAIAVFGVGTDRIDLNYAAAHDIQISITRDILTDDVADLALTLTLAFSRNLVAYHHLRSRVPGKTMR